MVVLSVPRWWEDVQGVSIEEVADQLLKNDLWKKGRAQTLSDAWWSLKRLEDLQVLRRESTRVQYHAVRMGQLLDFTRPTPKWWHRWRR